VCEEIANTEGKEEVKLNLPLRSGSLMVSTWENFLGTPHEAIAAVVKLLLSVRRP
jgi:hypothetical protein